MDETSQQKKFNYCVIYVYRETESSKRNLQLFIENGIYKNDEIYYVFAINDHILSIPVPNAKNIKILKRENIGHDFGAWADCLNTLDSNNMSFKHYIFMNDTVAGPFLPRYINKEKWYKMFCSLLSIDVKLSGLTINHDPWNIGRPDMQHVQSMMFCTDQTGLQILKRDIFSYRPAEFQNIYKKSRKNFIIKFEIGMSQKILNQGYKIAALYVADALKKKTGDVWYDDKYFGSTINPFETMFIKANRVKSSIIDLYTNFMMQSH